MKIPMYQVDAFASRPFAGNPAAVCVLDEWLEDGVLQDIASENNLAETAFIIKNADEYSLRWFTPTVEVDLCGHATLASAYVIFEFLEPTRREVIFNTMSGKLAVANSDDGKLVMDFPSRMPIKSDMPQTVIDAFNVKPLEVFQSDDLLVVFESEIDVQTLVPDLNKISEFKGCLGVVVTSVGVDVDFVSRSFAPNVGIAEDPVTGSTHCALIPFWAERLGKTKLHAKQLSQRGGELFCEDKGERVSIGGYATLFMKGEIYV